MRRGAVFSEDKARRFILTREWEAPEPRRTVNFIGLNPSKAGAEVDDMTVRKDIGFATRWGFNRIVLTNLRPEVSTDPWDLPYWRGFDQENVRCLHEIANSADLVIASWGCPPKALRQKIAMEEHIYHLRNNVFREVHCIGRTSKGWPLHPSRTAYTDAPLLFWEASSV